MDPTPNVPRPRPVPENDDDPASLRILQEKDKIIVSLKEAATQRDKLNENQIRILSEDNEKKKRLIKELTERAGELEQGFAEKSSQLDLFKERYQQFTMKLEELKGGLAEYKKDIGESLSRVGDMVSLEIGRRDERQAKLAERLQEDYKRLEEKLGTVDQQYRGALEGIAQKQTQAKAYIRKCLAELQEALNFLDIQSTQLLIDRRPFDEFAGILQDSGQAFEELASKTKDAGTIIKNIENMHLHLTSTPKLDNFFNEIDSLQSGKAAPPRPVQPTPAIVDELDSLLEQAFAEQPAAEYPPERLRPAAPPRPGAAPQRPVGPGTAGPGTAGPQGPGGPRPAGPGSAGPAGAGPAPQAPQAFAGYAGAPGGYAPPAPGMPETYGPPAYGAPGAWAAPPSGAPGGYAAPPSGAPGGYAAPPSGGPGGYAAPVAGIFTTGGPATGGYAGETTGALPGGMPGPAAGGPSGMQAFASFVSGGHPGMAGPPSAGTPGAQGPGQSGFFAYAGSDGQVATGPVPPPSAPGQPPPFAGGMFGPQGGYAGPGGPGGPGSYAGPGGYPGPAQAGDVQAGPVKGGPTTATLDPPSAPLTVQSIPMGPQSIKSEDDLIMRESPNLAPYNWDMLPATSPLLRFRRMLNNARRSEDRENYVKALDIYEIVKQQKTVQDNSLALNMLEDQIEAVNRLARAQVSDNQRRSRDVVRYIKKEMGDAD